MNTLRLSLAVDRRAAARLLAVAAGARGRHGDRPVLGLLQSITQIQDQSLPYGAKIICVGFVLMVTGPWAQREVARLARAHVHLHGRGANALITELHRLSGGLRVLHDPARGRAVPDSVRLQRVARRRAAAAAAARRSRRCPRRWAGRPRRLPRRAVEVVHRSRDRPACSASIFHAAAAPARCSTSRAATAIAATYDPNFAQEAALLETLFSQFAALTLFTGSGLQAAVRLLRRYLGALAARPRAPGLHSDVPARSPSSDSPASCREGVRLAAPLIGLMLLIDVALGLMSRHVKQLNPFTTARTVKAMVLVVRADV